MGALEKSLVSDLKAKAMGAGETTMVLSHGYGADQSIWEDILPDLARRCRVVVFDWNFSVAVRSSITQDVTSYSTYEAFADELVALLNEMDLKDVVFVGHSMAGMIGCIASVKRPGLFRRLVLLGASPRYVNTEDYGGGLERSQVEDILATIEHSFQPWAENFARLVVGGRDDPRPAEKFCKCLQSMRPDVALALANAVFLSDLRDVLDGVEVPCTIINGTNDVIVPMSVAHYMHRKIRGEASLEVLDFNGHFPQLTACPTLLDAFNRILCLEGADH